MKRWLGKYWADVWYAAVVGAVLWSGWHLWRALAAVLGFI